MSSSNPSRAAFYKRLTSSALQQLSTAPARDPFALLANIAALIYHSFHGEFGGAKNSVNWSGFYLVRQVAPSSSPDPSHPSPSSVLLLGPFHGLPAVSLIRIGKGVCGTAVQERSTQLVPDVHAHPNHIACDSASRSEIVVPIFADDQKEKLVGVLDIDSPALAFFSEEDQTALEVIVKEIGLKADWSGLEAQIEVKIPEDDSCPMNRPIKSAH